MSIPKPTRPPPPPAPRAGHVKVVKSMYRYEAQQNDELTFDEGETLYIIDTSDPNWWKARCGGRVGLIPSNYVEDNTEAIDHPLHEAAKRGNISFMRECITNGVSVNGLDKAGSTPLHWAAHGGHIDCMVALLAVKNCTINEQNKLGDTPLHSAAWKGHAEAVKILLEKGAVANLQNNDKKKPLDLAKDPATKALILQSVAPRTSSLDYGGDEDSD